MLHAWLLVSRHLFQCRSSKPFPVFSLVKLYKHLVLMLRAGHAGIHAGACYDAPRRVLRTISPCIPRRLRVLRRAPRGDLGCARPQGRVALRGKLRRAPQRSPPDGRLGSLFEHFAASARASASLENEDVAATIAGPRVII